MTSIPTNRVVTVTLNPAIDLTGHLTSLQLGSVNNTKSVDMHAAGKGINVAKVLSDLGAKVSVTGFLGNKNAHLFESLFSDIKTHNEFIYIDGETRINVKLVEENSQVTDLNFTGFSVSQDDIDKLEKKLLTLAKTHDYFVIAGSLPKNFSPEQCAKWVEMLRKLNKKVLFDSSKDAFRAGLTAKPWLIKPNNEELGEFIGQTLHSAHDCQDAIGALAKYEIENIVISLGADGVLWHHQGNWLQAKPPKMQVVSTVGAGDTLVAGLCWGHMQNMKKEQLLRHATALSALAVTQVGVGLSSKAQLDTIILQTQISN